MNYQEPLSLDAMKTKADVLISSFQKNGLPVKRTLALETVAQMYGYPNWSTARAAAKKRELATIALPTAPADELQNFDITVVRTGFGHRMLEVRATSEVQARELARDQAGEFAYSESTSEYAIEGKFDWKEAFAPREDWPTPEEAAEGPLAVYLVAVCRMSFGSKTLTYRAKTEEEAETMALDDAGNHYFDEDDADYVIGGISLKK